MLVNEIVLLRDIKKARNSTDSPQNSIPAPMILRTNIAFKGLPTKLTVIVCDGKSDDVAFLVCFQRTTTTCIDLNKTTEVKAKP